jgi:hypothetical protein
LTPAAPLPYTGGVIRKSAALLAFLVVLGAAPAVAEHAVGYRYIVLGYVHDPAGQRRPGVEVELVREKTGFSYLAKTDATGLYVIVARLGDESAGEALRVRAASQSVTIRARFDPADHSRERGTRLDFVAAGPVELPTAFVPTLQRFLAQ